MNAHAFFTHIRQTLFKGTLTQGQVDTINAILDACHKHHLCDPRQIAYVLATAKHEAYHPKYNPEFAPVREGFTKTNMGARRAVTNLYNAGRISVDYGQPEKNGKSYYGRGYVQITWPGNYAKLGKRLDIPLYDNPDLALQKDVAAEILVVGMKEGQFTGRKLDSYINDKVTLFVQSRRIINGMDKAELIADYAEEFYKALTKL